MFSHAQRSRSHKLKNPRRHDEDLGGVTLTPCNPSKLQSSKTLSVPARKNCEPSSSGDRDKLLEQTLQRTPMKLSVQPERETDDEQENRADNDFCPSPQQSFQPEHHGLEEKSFNEDEDAFISNYHSDLKLSRRHTSLEEKRIDMEMPKEKNRNLELWHAMKYTRTFSGLKKSSIPYDLDASSDPKRKRSIIVHTIRTSVFLPSDRKQFRRLNPRRKVQLS